MLDSVASYVKAGGIFMYPILLCSAWALLLLVERVVFYIQCGWRLERRRQEFFETLDRHGPDAAAKLASSWRGVLANVLRTALDNRTQPAQEIERKMETVLYRDLPVYRRYLGLLAALAGILPVLGLLGTVNGMIQTFSVVAVRGSGDPRAMAAGISVALITTQSGLSAALPVVVGHVLLSSRFRRITEKTREACAQLLDYLREHHA